jgi:RNA ligase partner protein
MTEAPPAEPLCIILDTSVFTNPDTSAQFGPNTAAAVQTFVDLARRATGKLRCAMPPSIFDELRTFVNADELPRDFEWVVALKAPNRYDVVVPGFLLYELIDDIRTRIDRGLRVAEKAVRTTGPKNVDATINRLRSEYREALRAGLLDSREDVDLILLARELDAALVSSDQGVVTWAEKLGIRLIQPEQLKRMMEGLLD